MLILIDGYNLIYALNYEGVNLSKEDLINELLCYQKRKKNNVIVVFDGGIYGGITEREEKIGNLKVIYTSKIKTADDKIKELSDKYRNGCVVITSDRGIKNHVRRNGTPTMDSEDFIKRLFNYDSTSDDNFKKIGRKEKTLLKKV
ncbi:MAG: NYN domain-containing protein [Proteobacteria bacterium]|nr:NYN domain-containing protein [Pseudomonadota bacterium]